MKFVREKDVPYQLGLLLNNGLTFQDNVQGGFVSFTTALGVNTIQHNLGFIPIGWIMIYNEAEVSFYAEAPLTWTKNVMYLNASVASVPVRLFVM